MIDFDLSVEQTKRSGQDIDAIHEVAHQNLMLSAEGRFDGLTGLPPSEKITEQAYWAGYCVGLRQHWLSQLGIELETEF